MYLLFGGSVGKAQDYPGHCTCSSRGLGGNGGLATLPGQCDQYSQVPVLCSTVLCCALLRRQWSPLGRCVHTALHRLAREICRTHHKTGQQSGDMVQCGCVTVYPLAIILHPPPFPCTGHRTGARLRGTLYTSSSSTEATEVTEVTVVSRLGMKFSLGPAEVTAVAGAAAASASPKLAQLMSSSGSARHHTSYIYRRQSHM